MDLDPVFLSRIQFALTIMFHYLFPPLTIGLGALMVVMEGLYLRTKDPLYESMAHFWTKVFAVNFAVGVASGIVMEFQFGTNWASYSRFVGDVFGSALAAEGIFAFFLESGFLAVLVFGWDRVSAKMHFFATLMVSLGSIFSAIWIVVANSWQQTPAGFRLVPFAGGMRAETEDFWAVVFNPSTLHRLNHTLLGAFILGGLFVMSVSAFYLLRNRHREFARRGLHIALAFTAAASLLMLVSGHFNARMVARHQPAKLAAFEGHFETGTGPAGMHLFGVPDTEARTVRYGIEVPALLTFLVHDDLTTPVTGLDKFPREDWPPVGIPFQTYHLMIALGGFFIAISLLGLWFWRRGTLTEQRWLLWTYVFAVGGGFAANEAGWVAAEVGRQPWVVQGMLRTADGVSRSVKGSEVLASIILFSLIYALLFAVWLFVLDHKIKHGPDAIEPALAGPGKRATGRFVKGAASSKLKPGASLTSEEDETGPVEGGPLGPEGGR